MRQGYPIPRALGTENGTAEDVAAIIDCLFVTAILMKGDWLGG